MNNYYTLFIFFFKINKNSTRGGSYKKFALQLTFLNCFALIFGALGTVILLAVYLFIGRTTPLLLNSLLIGLWLVILLFSQVFYSKYKDELLELNKTLDEDNEPNSFLSFIEFFVTIAFIVSLRVLYSFCLGQEIILY